MERFTTPDETLDAPDGDSPGSRARDVPALERGEVVSRYVVLSKLGAGGMGVVYSAYDPELDRKIALKLVRPRSTRNGSGGGSRLVREAQALAKLSHPNIVGIHDVGTHGRDVWLAMEFVAGQTLKEWLAERPRGWREVLAVLRPVAIGLAAAHEADLVHRDVKPDNVMLGDDGRVRLMDFGLARGKTRSMDSEASRSGDGASGPPSTDDEVIASISQRGKIEAAVTRVGALVGTPAYMAPEQISGRETDARTDQFSFCVTMWEALYGRRPFAGESLLELVSNLLAGRTATPPRGAAVPRWLRRVLERGLSARPGDRWPSMPELLAALQRGRGRARAGKGVASVGAIGLVAAAAVGWQSLEEDRRVKACEAEGDAISEVWNQQTRDAVRASLLATGAGHASTTADRLMPWLDAQADDWRAARTEACLDVGVRHVWDAEVLDRSVWCLDERRLGLASLVSRLQDADVETVTSAVLAVVDLPPVDPCRDQVLLQRLPAPPDQSRDEIRAVRTKLSDARALEATGAYEAGLTAAREGLQGAQKLAWPPLIAAAQVDVGDLLRATGDYEAAAQALEAGYFAAVKAGAIQEVVSAAHALTYTVGHHLARHEAAERWARHAEAMAWTLPDPTGLRQAENLDDLALLRHATGAYPEALDLYGQALEIRERALGPEHLGVAQTLNNLAIVQRAMGNRAEAVALHERALQIRELALGDDHPKVADSLDNLGVAQSEVGEHGRAADLLARALEIRERALGPEHPAVARTLGNLANAREAEGDYEDAARLLERGLSLLERTLGPDHPDVATMLGSLAGVYKRLERYDEAVRLHERALQIREATLGPKHPRVGISYNNLAEVHYAAGAYDEAQAEFEHAREIFDEALGDEHPLLAHPLAGLARVEMARGRAKQAVPLADRALTLQASHDASPLELAAIRMLLARALADAGQSKSRAVGLAVQARDAFREAGDARVESLADAEAWLAEHA